MIAKFDNCCRSGDGSGLKDYLENATNNDRDKKDKRVTLYGNLDVLLSTIKLAHNKGYKETYKNIVVSFEEDYISKDDLINIATQYAKQYTQGYEDDEVTIYAEAHLPKIKSKNVIDEISGLATKTTRKPHIHITYATYSSKLNKKVDFNSSDKRIYDINLLTRKIESAFGFKQPTLKAIQKDITQIKKTTNLNDRKDIIFRINNYIESNINQIESYEELKKNLTHEFNLNIIRESTSRAKVKSITILHNNKKIRIKGELFHSSTFENAKRNMLDSKENFEPKYQDKKISHDSSSRQFLKLKKELDLYNLNRKEDIDKRNHYARIQSNLEVQKKVNKDNLRAEIRNYISYQAKLYKSIYGKKINYDLRGFYIKKYAHQPTICIVSNKVKQIKVIDKGNQLIADDTNIKEQVSIMLEMAKTKKWDFSNLSVSGTDLFKDEVAKQLNQLNHETSTNLSIVKDTEDKSRDIPEEKYETTKDEQIKDKINFEHLKKRLDPILILEEFNLNPKTYPISKNSKGEYRIKCGNRSYSNIDFMINEMNYNLDVSCKALHKIHAKMIKRQFDHKSLDKDYNKGFNDTVIDSGKFKSEQKSKFKRNRF